MKTIACAAAAFVLIAAPALADDKFAPPPLHPKKTESKHHDWTGFYVGGQMGLAQGKSKWSADDASGSSSSFSSTSPTFGAHAGYNYQFGQGVVLGGESDVSPK